MCMRNCRIACSVITLMTMAVAIALTAAALATQSWQIADLSTYPQIRRIYSQGLIDNCIHYVQSTNQIVSNPFGGPPDFFNYNPNQADLVVLGPPWQGQGNSPQFQNIPTESERCARIPYSNYYFGIMRRPQEVSQIMMNQVQQTQVQNMRWFILNDLRDPATSHGFVQMGEDWRLATLILLAVACGFGLFALIAEMTGSCLDCFNLNMCLKAASVTSFVLMVVAVLSGLTGIALFASYTGQREEIYIFEQNAIAKFQWGGSFWLGLAGVGAAGVAVLFDLLHLLLLRGSVKNHSPRYKKRLPTRRSIDEMYDRLPVVIESDGSGMILEEVREKH